MNAVDALSLERFCATCGIAGSLEMEQIRAGRNSEVWRLRSAGKLCILKNYFQDALDGRNRLGTEYRFLQFLSEVGVDRVPRPLGIDMSAHRAIYSHLPGSRPIDVTEAHVKQAASFIASINYHRTTVAASGIGNASEACFSMQDHLDLTDGRLRRWMAIPPATDVHIQAYAFMRDTVIPAWESMRTRLLNATGMPVVGLSSNERVLSPSDFGFHNSLEKDGDLGFVDFEYAGWDDPAKLICDFMCQPELPVTERQGQQFMAEIMNQLPGSEAIEHRVRSFLPVHRFKWVGILLNEFRAGDRQRRVHAGVDSEGLLMAQLTKARTYFEMHLAHLN